MVFISGKNILKKTPLEKFYDQSKILAEPSKFHIKSDEIEDFATFLKEELGVSDSPRKKDRGIDGLESILKNGSTKYIIRLLLQNRDFLNAYKNQSSTRSTFCSNKWITKKGRRYAPAEVILTSKRNYHRISDYVKDEFLFMSQDELLSGIQMEKSSKIWLIEEYLCFNTEIRDLDNEYIYKILNELPTFDLHGEISEDVYKGIIIDNNDREKPDIDSPEFNRFVNFGKVFCYDKAYHSVTDCLYLEKKYPSVIESEHNFINIVKGKSPNAIWDRLHVDTLSIDYHLGNYVKSKSNTIDFKNDLNNFKILILVKYNDYFDSEDVLEQLRNINIVLCDVVDVKYENKIGSLKNYEFVNEGDEFYVKVPNRSFVELKHNDRFQDVLSEIFVAKYGFLDKDGTARAIGCDINSRIDRAKNDFGNNAWSEAEVKLDLLSLQNKDYSSENAEILSNLRDRYFEEYEHRLYSKLKNASIEEKMSFVDELISYKNHEFNMNDMPTDKNADMLDFLFGVYPLLDEDIVIIKDINSVRTKHYSDLRLEFSDNIDILEWLLDDNRFESLLRFGELIQIRNEMHTMIEKMDTPKTSMSHFSKIKTYNKPLVNVLVNAVPSSNEDHSVAIDDHLNNITERSKGTKSLIHCGHRKIINYGDDAQYVDFDDIKPKIQQSEVKNINSHSRQMSTIAKKAQENRAKKAEKIVVGKLKKLGYTNVLWVSAYAKDEGVNPNGADGYGYDIQCEIDGQIRYIEVKASLSSTGVEFEMSENELSFCSQHANNYDIAYVYNMNARSPKITLIKNVFYKINDNNKLPASYKIKLK